MKTRILLYVNRAIDWEVALVVAVAVALFLVGCRVANRESEPAEESKPHLVLELENRNLRYELISYRLNEFERQHRFVLAADCTRSGDGEQMQELCSGVDEEQHVYAFVCRTDACQFTCGGNKTP